MGRPPCCDKSNVKRGLWTPEEDAKLLACVANHGIGNWTVVPQKAGLNRCGKSCRLRWTNYLRPDLKHDDFTPQEEQLILELHKAIGSRWSLIAKQLPGRTDNDVKNYWNTKLRKKLYKMGIDAVTRKPLSRVLSDYGNISGLSNTRSHIDSFADSTNNNGSLTNSEPSIASTTLPNTNILNMPTMDQIQHDIPQFPNSHTLDSLVESHFRSQNTIQPHFFNEIASSTSSSSPQLSSSHSFSCPPPSSHLQMPPSSPSGWNDFLLGEPSPSNDAEKHDDCLERLSSTSRYESGLSGGRHDGIGGNSQTDQCYEDANSSSANSFVESILDKYSKMQMEFPQLLDEYIN